ncbi:MAG: hypothetical protein ACI37S_07345 [Candidatus Gastranaerophilaceae bacterium]
MCIRDSYGLSYIYYISRDPLFNVVPYSCSNEYVDVFLFIRYLLGKGFYNGKYKTNKNGIIGFYISRFVRIVPMYLLFTFILSVVVHYILEMPCNALRNKLLEKINK